MKYTGMCLYQFLILAFLIILVFFAFSISPLLASWNYSQSCSQVSSLDRVATFPGGTKLSLVNQCADGSNNIVDRVLSLTKSPRLKKFAIPALLLCMLCPCSESSQLKNKTNKYFQLKQNQKYFPILKISPHFSPESCHITNCVEKFLDEVVSPDSASKNPDQLQKQLLAVSALLV